MDNGLVCQEWAGYLFSLTSASRHCAPYIGVLLYEGATRKRCSGGKENPVMLNEIA